MASTLGEHGKSLVDETEFREQIDRITHSSTLKTCELLRELLLFMADRAQAHPFEPAKEKQIAESVFKRVDFDPQTDSVVRVHTSRLRSKLAEYYINEGGTDKIIVHLARGAYLLTCEVRPGPEPAAPPGAEAGQPAATPAARVRSLVWPLLCACLVVALAVVLFIRTRPVPFQRSSPALKTFWADFLAPDALDPLIEFSTGDYVGSEITGMWIRKRPDEGPRIDTHTGIGELIATSALTRNFVTLGRPAQLKGAEFLTWDEARDRNIVFLGSPVTNRPLRDVPRLQDFGFKLRTEEPRMDDAALVNFHPGPGEQNYYFYSSSAPDTKDYAVIALAPSTDLSRRALILAGITTVSTQAAGEFVCRPESVAELLARLGVRSGARVPDFEAVLEITRIGAVPIKSQLLIVRVREK